MGGVGRGDGCTGDGSGAGVGSAMGGITVDDGAVADAAAAVRCAALVPAAWDRGGDEVAAVEGVASVPSTRLAFATAGCEKSSTSMAGTLSDIDSCRLDPGPSTSEVI